MNNSHIATKKSLTKHTPTMVDVRSNRVIVLYSKTKRNPEHSDVAAILHKTLLGARKSSGRYDRMIKMPQSDFNFVMERIKGCDS